MYKSNYRPMKVITVPLTHSAVRRLDYDVAEPGDLIEMKLEDETFHELAKCGLFDKINALSNKIIDEFEDEMIVEQSQLQAILESHVFEPGNYPASLSDVLARIEAMFKEALTRSTGVYFYF
ncbi:hypothetical protein GCM10007423_02630 [Dyadobacter endophyticus]|uniref:Uncharacterized protein n=2 Tax=Spirosomataceae TaxID=2896860 RepID=A0ABQ1YEG0_9BACT|nr:hypothetical protein GCM10007423_02630 [Dyadobacter endophyticus]